MVVWDSALVLSLSFVEQLRRFRPPSAGPLFFLGFLVGGASFSLLGACATVSEADGALQSCAPCVCPACPDEASQALVCQAPVVRTPAADSRAGAAADGAKVGTRGPLSESELLARYEGVGPARVLTGKATYYGDSLAGNRTANGEIYQLGQFSAAHKTLPFGTVVRVVRTDTNRYVYVRINDRGPFAGKERIIDLSRIAAERLGMIRAGVVPVRVEVMP